LAQTDKSPEPETDTSPYAANTISSQEDYWETDYWETMIQEYPEGQEVDQNNDLVMIEHDYTKELTSFYKGLCKLLGEEQTTSHSSVKKNLSYSYLFPSYPQNKRNKM